MDDTRQKYYTIWQTENLTRDTTAELRTCNLCIIQHTMNTVRLVLSPLEYWLIHDASSDETFDQLYMLYVYV